MSTNDWSVHLNKQSLREILELADYLGLDFETAALLVRAAILANQLED